MDKKDYDKVTLLARGCDYMIRKNLNSTLPRKLAMFLTGMSDYSTIKLPRAGDNNITVYKIVSPPKTKTETHMIFPEETIVNVALPDSRYFKGSIEVGNNSLIVVSWQENITTAVNLQLTQKNNILTMTSGGIHDIFKKNVIDQKFEVVIIGHHNRRESIRCYRLSHYFRDKVRVTTRGNLDENDPDYVSDCPYVDVSGHLHFYGHENSTFTLNLAPPYNITETNRIQIRLDDGNAVLYISHIDLFHTLGNVSFSLTREARVVKFSLEPALDIEIIVNYRMRMSQSIKIQDKKSVIAIDWFDNTPARFTRLIPLIESCPQFVYSLNASALVNITDNWSNALITTVVEFSNCTVIVGNRIEDIISPRGGLVVIYGQGGHDTVIIKPIINSTVSIQNDVGLGLHKLIMYSVQNFTFLRKEYNLLLNNFDLSLFVDVEDYFNALIKNKWVVVDGETLTPLKIVNDRGNYQTVPHFYFDALSENSFTFSSEAREIWSNCYIDADENEILYGNLSGSLTFTSPETAKNRIEVVFEDFFTNSVWSDILIVFERSRTFKYLTPSIKIPGLRQIV